MWIGRGVSTATCVAANEKETNNEIKSTRAADQVDAGAGLCVSVVDTDVVLVALVIQRARTWRILIATESR